MTTIVTRANKGSPLTNTEMDANLTNLNTDKLETSTAAATYFTITDAALKIDKTSNAGAALMPAGTTAERPVTPQYGATRANSTLNQQEWWNGTAWVPMGGGATGAPGNTVFFENDITVTGNYTITAGKNAMSAGPITIADGVSVTVPNGSSWSIV